jgi:nicotinamide-nucleotide amidase
MDDRVEALVLALAGALTARGEMLATAESCTGGWIAKVCTDMAGSSSWFERGFVAYSTQSKQDMLGVSSQTLELQGAVSEAVVTEMAAGALARSAAQWSLAISGIAGPGGGSVDKPVGRVWLAWAGPGDWRLARCCQFDGDRHAVRRQSVEAALLTLCERCGATG